MKYYRFIIYAYINIIVNNSIEKGLIRISPHANLLALLKSFGV